jgi:hypothetical protein
MKTCGFEKMINAYLDGELSGAKLRSFEEHLPACPRCREDVEQYRSMLEALRGAVDREVPPMLQERLHAALSKEISKGEGRMKRRVNPWVLAPVVSAAVVVCAVGGVLLFGNPSGSQNAKMAPPLGLQIRGTENAESPYAGNGTADRASNDVKTAPIPAPAATNWSATSTTKGGEAQRNESYATANFGFDKNAAATGQNAPSDERKLIYTAYVVEETREFDKSMSGVNAMLAEYGGYIESSQQSGVPEGYESTQGRNAVLSLRVPIGKYGDAMGRLQALGNLLSKNENTQDVSLQYLDTKTRMDTLVKERDQYMALLEKADNTESIIALRNEITSLTVQIEQDTAQLRYWDSQVSYSTITVELREVVIPKSVGPSNPTSLGDRAGGAFYQTLNDMKKGLESFAVWFVGFLPWLAIIVVVAGIAAAIVVPVARKHRKAALKKAAEEKKKED